MSCSAVRSAEFILAVYDLFQWRHQGDDGSCLVAATIGPKQPSRTDWPNIKVALKGNPGSQLLKSESHFMNPSDELQSAYTTNNPSEAEILRAALQAEGIECEISGQGQAGLAGILEIQLLVRAEDVDRARHYLERHHHD